MTITTTTAVLLVDSPSIPGALLFGKIFRGNVIGLRQNIEISEEFDRDVNTYQLTVAIYTTDIQTQNSVVQLILQVIS